MASSPQTVPYGFGGHGGYGYSPASSPRYSDVDDGSRESSPCSPAIVALSVLLLGGAVAAVVWLVGRNNKKGRPRPDMAADVAVLKADLSTERALRQAQGGDLQSEIDGLRGGAAKPPSNKPLLINGGVYYADGTLMRHSGPANKLRFSTPQVSTLDVKGRLQKRPMKRVSDAPDAPQQPRKDFIVGPTGKRTHLEPSSVPSVDSIMNVASRQFASENKPSKIVTPNLPVTHAGAAMSDAALLEIARKLVREEGIRNVSDRMAQLVVDNA